MGQFVDQQAQCRQSRHQANKQTLNVQDYKKLNAGCFSCKNIVGE